MYITNQDNEVQKLYGKSGVVIRLTKYLFGTTCKLLLDNWYSSEPLFRLLEKNQLLVDK